MRHVSQWLATSVCLMSSTVFAASSADAANSQSKQVVNPSEQWGGQAPYRISERNGFFLEAEALVWQMRTSISYTSVVKPATVNGLSGKQLSFKNASPDWDWGFRLGLGYVMPHDDWELSLDWTRVEMSGSGHTTAGSGEVLTILAPNPFQPQTVASNAKSHISMRLNYLDLMLKREFLVTKWIGIKPGLGLRSNWMKGNLNASFSGGNIAQAQPTSVATIQDNFKNNSWGIGPRAGLDLRMVLGQGFSIEGDLAFSYLFGSYDLAAKSNKPLVPPNQPVNMKDKLGQTMPVFDSFLGLRWDRMLDNNRYHISLNFGWEHHVFFQAIQADLAQSFDVNNSNITTQGFTFGGRFDF